MALYPAPNRADAAANLVSSPRGRAATASRRRSRPITTAGRTAPIQVRYSYSREDRDLPFPTRSRNLPGLRRRRARPGAPVLGVGCRGRRARMFNETRVRRERARSRQRAAERRRRPVRRARHHAAAARPAVDQGYLDHRRARLRDARRRPQPAGAPADAHAPPVRDARRRPRPAPRQDRRRAAALPVGRLQPPVRARPGDVHRRVHRPSGRRPAARLSDHHAARRQRQPAGAAHLVGERASRRTTGASRRA